MHQVITGNSLAFKITNGRSFLNISLFFPLWNPTAPFLKNLLLFPSLWNFTPNASFNLCVFTSIWSTWNFKCKNLTQRLHHLHNALQHFFLPVNSSVILCYNPRIFPWIRITSTVYLILPMLPKTLYPHKYLVPLMHFNDWKQEGEGVRVVTITAHRLKSFSRNSHVNWRWQWENKPSHLF